MSDSQEPGTAPRRRQRLLIQGRVQGVFFRASVCEQARSLGLSGWVRNLPDGTVEAVAEGDQGAIEALVKYCFEGPPLARVTGIERTDEPPEQLTSFELRY
jgi:acylphosphatase